MFDNIYYVGTRHPLASARFQLDLGGDAAACAGIAQCSFGSEVDLDASMDSGANVTAASIHSYSTALRRTFRRTDVPAF